MVELNYESGWWEVQFLSRAGSTLRVLAVRYGKVHEVSSSALRPGWTCKEGGAWEYGLGGVVKPAEEWAANIAANPHASRPPPGGAAAQPASTASTLRGRRATQPVMSSTRATGSSAPAQSRWAARWRASPGASSDRSSGASRSRSCRPRST